MTNVQLENVGVTVKMRTGVGPWRLNQLVDTDPETAAGLMSANLARLMPAEPKLALPPAPPAAEGADDGTPARAKGSRQSRRRATAGNAVGNGVHDIDDAQGSKHLEGADPGRSGNSEG